MDAGRITFHHTRLYGQPFEHKISCSKEESRWCWTLPQLLKVTNNNECSNYVSANYYLDDNSAADDKDDDGYFSNKTLPEDERDEVTDEDFLKHLDTPNSLGVNDRKHQHNEDLMNDHSEDNLSLEDMTGGFGAKSTLINQIRVLKTTLWVLTRGSFHLSHFMMMQ
jgi:hypothetical protein